ncbi:MAG: NAD(P)H-dependent oxidoreductase [Clostridiales bacterium]|nr:NAD(P)H-dependent oxidoreductase [Clostridiales bacterium]
MKKILSLILAIAVTLSLAACATTGTQEADSVESQQETQVGSSSEMETSSSETSETGGEQDSSVLVAYFSWADNAILADDVDVISSPSVTSPGNVQQLAGWVQEETGGDLFSIQVTDPYSSDWDECLARANQERGEDARPELTANVANLEQYDTVFLGYPNWWYGVPMALLSFLEQNDLSGKQVYLFCSHGTGGLARSVEIITEAAPDAVISDDIFDCYEEEAASSQSDIQNWVAGLGY